MLKEMLERVRETAPLIHNITNDVTVNDCANIVIACGAAPIMADEKEEVEESKDEREEKTKKNRKKRNLSSMIIKLSVRCSALIGLWSRASASI